MQFGAHVSIAGGIENAPINAAKIGCGVFQMFTRSPRGGATKFIDDTFAKFKTNCKKLGFTDYYIHAPYYINLASSNNKIRYGSIHALRDELEVGTQIGAKYMMAHLGSAKDFSDEEALEKVVEAINKILDGYKGTTEFLIEMSAGAGRIIGATFEEIALILSKIKNQNVGVCFDTCHAFDSGYDLRTKAAVSATFKKFDQIIGLDKLKLFHFNDSKTEIGSRKDRHADIGTGFIGLDGFKALVKHPAVKKLNAVIETPAEKMSYEENLELLKKLRAEI